MASLDAISAGLAVAPQDVGVMEIVEDSGGHRVAVGGRDQPAGQSFHDQLGIAAHSRRDDRQPARHSLKNRVRDALGERGQDEAIETAHDVGNVAPLARQPCQLAQSGLGQDTFDLGPQRTIAHHDETQPRT